MLNPDEYKTRFSYHPPKDEATANRHEEIRYQCEFLTRKLASLVPESRELALAITKVEEAMMWANAGIARHQD
jgi:hypothetical protein